MELARDTWHRAATRVRRVARVARLAWLAAVLVPPLVALVAFPGVWAMGGGGV